MRQLFHFDCPFLLLRCALWVNGAVTPNSSNLPTSGRCLRQSDETGPIPPLSGLFCFHCRRVEMGCGDVLNETKKMALLSLSSSLFKLAFPALIIYRLLQRREPRSQPRTSTERSWRNSMAFRVRVADVGLRSPSAGTLLKCRKFGSFAFLTPSLVQQRSPHAHFCYHIEQSNTCSKCFMCTHCNYIVVSNFCWTSWTSIMPILNHTVQVYPSICTYFLLRSVLGVCWSLLLSYDKGDVTPIMHFNCGRNCPLFLFTVLLH